MKPEGHEIKLITCMTCKFFVRAPGSKDTGICKANPPQVSIIMMVQHNPISNSSQQMPMPISAFPQVTEGEWCGGHTMKWSVGGES